MPRALDRIQIDCDDAGCVVVGIARNGARVHLTPRLTPFVARDHAHGHAEFYGCQVVSTAQPEPTPVRVQRWGGQ
jgi:hypothetical protein